MEIIRQGDFISTPTAATIGMFDGVHCGHRFVVDFLKRTARENNLKSAVITFSNHPQTVLHPDSEFKTIMSISAKVKALENTGIDYTILLDFSKQLSELTAKEFLRVIKEKYGVRLLLIGYDHRFGHNSTETFSDYVEYGKEIGITVIQSPEYGPDALHISSSAIRKQLAAGNIEVANSMLGRPFTLSGKVVKGFQNGRKIGFPTANVDVDKNIILPKGGVYVATATLQSGEVRGGMLNIGRRPTFNNSCDISIEINIFDFSEDIYDQQISVSIYSRLRDEKKMDSISKLIDQLKEDEINIRKILKKYNL